MSLAQWLEDELIERRSSSPEEIRELFGLVDRDLGVAAEAVTVADWRFIIAYQAALSLATLVVRAAGYRTLGASHHFLTFEILGEVGDPEWAATVRYFQAARAKRNAAEYRRAGQIDARQAQELLEQTRQFRGLVVAWLRRHHPGFVPASEE
jgi:hypothetical protein